MNVPILGKRREAKQAALVAAIESSVEKAMQPAIAAAQGLASSGATYALNASSPFGQSGGYGGAYDPLPRGNNQFTSQFGPGWPLIPDPLDPLDASGRAQPRRAQYPVSINVNLFDREVPWSNLKWMARNCDIISRCIELVQDGLVGREWSWGFSDDIIQQIMGESNGSITNHAKAMQVAKEKYGNDLNRVKEFFARPDSRSNHIFSQFLSECIWQSLTYDAVVIYPQFTLGGDLYSLSPIDPSTIKILLDNQGFPPEPPAPAYQQILYGFPRGEFQATDSQDIEGEYQRDQLAYYIRRTRPESVYGFSPVEECMNIAQTYLERQAWMRAEYTNGSTPKTYFKVAEGSTWTPEQNETFELHLNDRLAGQNRRRQMGFLLPNGIEPEQMRQIEETYKSDYDNWLVTQIGSKFGVPATQLGVQAKAGLSGGKQMEGETGQTEQFVFNAIINFFVDILNDLARRYLNVGDEITATCQDPGDNEENILQQSQADTQDVNNGRLTLNDWRAKRGLPLYDMPEADEPFIASAQGPVFLKGTLAVQDANTENTLNPPPPPTKIMVGPDGKPLPQLPTGSANGGSDTNANGGLQSVSSGTGTSEAKPDGSAGPSGAGGTNDQSSKVDDDGNSTASAAPADTKSPDESGASKELAAFIRFAKGRIDRGTWRDFDFTTIESVRARRLNEYGRLGQLDLIKADSDSLPFAAGIIVKARDTQRVLLVQRSIDNQNTTAAGLWEIPGGKLADETDAFKAAKREWQEETGIKLPDGDLFDSFTSQNGRYTTFIWMIDHESDIELENARGLDGSGDNEVENVAWWNINDLQNNPAVRAELQSIDWATLAHAKSTKKALAQKAGQTTRNWQDHPNNALHDKIVAHYAPLLVQAFKDSIHGIHEAIAEAKRKASNAKNANKSLVKAGIEDAQAAVNANITMQPEDVAHVLRQMIGDAYLAGSHNAAAMVGGGAKVLESLEGANTAMDWANWTPGWLQAAGNVRDGGLADLLSQATATIQGINGTAMTRLGNVLADGIAGGDSVGTIAGNMSDFALTPERALIVANTETARSMVSATMSTYDVNGVDQWEWLAEDDACPICDALNGQTFDVDDSGAEQIPEHPSCFPSGTITSGSQILGSTSRWFDGELIEIGTAAGEFLSVTTNHPILTDNGWVAAGLLNEGSNVIRCTDIERVILLVDPDNHYGPSLIEDVAETLGGASRVATTRMPSSAVDFHGDGLDGNVNIVRTNGLLGLHDESQIAQHVDHFVFPITHIGSSNVFVSNSDLDALVHSGGSAPGSDMGRLSKSHALVGVGVGHSDEHRIADTPRFDSEFDKATTDYSASDAEFNRESLFWFSAAVAVNDAIGNDDSFATGDNPTAFEFSTQGTHFDAGDVASLLKSLSGLVEYDRIVHLRRVGFSGQVFNLQTTTGWYVANGIIAHNCRCAPLPVVSGQDTLQPTLDSGEDTEDAT